MKLVVNNSDNHLLAGKELSKLGVLKWKIKSWWAMNIRRRIPYLVWYGQDVDVAVNFTNLRLAPDCTVDNIMYEGDMDALWKAEEMLSRIGLKFDRGTGLNSRDWEWDYSLRGDIKISFRKPHKGDRRLPDKKPPLVVIKGASA